MSEKEKLVLFLGSADREGVTAKLQAVGSMYKRKMLESSEANWKTIIKLFDEFEITSVVVKLTNTTFSILSSKSYEVLVDELLTRIAEKPNLFLAHESLITGERSKIHEESLGTLDEFDSELEEEYKYLSMHYSDLFEPPDKMIREKVVGLLEQYNIHLTPYQKNVELSLIASAFIDQNEHNLIFRMYVPSNRMWANEAEKLLQLFRDYLHKVAGLEVRQDQYRTNQGVVYEFFGEEGLNPTILPQKFNEFSSFMDTCSRDPGNAAALLKSTSLNKAEVFQLVDRYGKEARRLHIDLRQEREMKLLTIRHQLESELSEHVRTDHDWQVIDRVVDSTLPSLNSVSSAISVDQKSMVTTSQNFIVNVNPQIIDTVNGVIAQQIIGDQHLGPDAKQLLEIIDQYAGQRKTELTSALHELTDTGAKDEDRLVAKHKLKGFLLSVGGKIGDVATGVLQASIESQLGL